MTILVVDDHSIVRDGLCVLLDQVPGFKIIGTAATGAEAVAAAARLRPDVVIMDLMLPSLNGIEATRQICAGAPQTRIIVLSACHGAEQVHRALRSGARAYLSKSAGSDELIRAVRLVTAEEKSAGTDRAACGSDGALPAGLPGSPLDCLTPREHEVLQRIAAGCTSSDIARALCLSRKTVDTYRARMMTKLGVATRSALVQLALEYELPLDYAPAGA